MVVQLVRTRGLSLDDLLTVLDAKSALATKLQPNCVRYYQLTHLHIALLS